MAIIFCGKLEDRKKCIKIEHWIILRKIETLSTKRLICKMIIARLALQPYSYLRVHAPCGDQGLVETGTGKNHEYGHALLNIFAASSIQGIRHGFICQCRVRVLISISPDTLGSYNSPSSRVCEWTETGPT
jgi:hypothetical protein